jgi:hypothetical protein
MMGGGLPPEVFASLQQLHARMQTPLMGSAAPPPGTLDPSFKYCAKRGTRTEATSRFCKSCGAAL